MAKASPKLTAKKPVSLLQKPLKADLKQLFKALAKGIGHTTVGKWEELGTDTAEALSALGLTTEPGELAFLLIRRSLTMALFELIGESASQHLVEPNKEPDALLEQCDLAMSTSEIPIDLRFFDRPGDLPLIKNLQPLLSQWLQDHGLEGRSAQAVAERLPVYFVYALTNEWRRNAKAYGPLLEARETPFGKAGEREWGWAAYAALLQRRIEESIFDEPFSLKQIYVPLHAYYVQEDSRKDSVAEVSLGERRRHRIVVSLDQELEEWLRKPDGQDAIRVVSGGPGSGKSSFARIFAARIAEEGRIKVLFVPLHLIDPANDLVEEVECFVRDEGVLIQNPLDPESPEPKLLIIFDGLDELASQGRAAAETARAFVREVERTVERRNRPQLRLRVLISGRELVVQENESEFRRPSQILTLLPYYFAGSNDTRDPIARGEDEYEDPKGLLRKDLRQAWWKNYGRLTAKAFQTLPPELGRPDLDEITAQPLLNYLVALSYSRGKLDFTQDIQLNAIYADLVAAVHERGYEKRRAYVAIRKMSLEDFSRVLEEIGLAAWHGDGRTTTVREIEEHCRTSGVGKLLNDFREGAEAGVTRLLAAFFFRQHGRRESGDPTFVFTHKSFGEYLTARRVVRATERVIRELERRDASPDEGWDERDALKHWTQICGPTAISRYLHAFLLNELRLRDPEEVDRWQRRLTALFSYLLRSGTPMEQLQIASFREMLFQSRNAEEALLVILNGCARVTHKVSEIEHPDPRAFGAWFKRIQGQRSGPESVLAAECLSFLNLSAVQLDIADLYGANLAWSNLRDTEAYLSCLVQANLEGANVKGAVLGGANLRRANLERANLEGANLQGANLERANLERAHLRGANLERADLEGANPERADLGRSNLERADLEGANLRGRQPKRRLPK